MDEIKAIFVSQMCFHILEANFIKNFHLFHYTIRYKDSIWCESDTRVPYIKAIMLYIFYF